MVNGYYKSNSYTNQVNRIIEEFQFLEIKIEIYSNKEPIVIGQKFKWDFVIFLDKDINFAKILQESGVIVINSPNAIELADNKNKTSIYLSKYDIKLPKTIPAPKQYKYQLDINYCKKVIEILKLPLIVKSAYGSLGMQVYKADTLDELIKIVDNLKCEEFCYQEYVKTSEGISIRAILIDKKVVCAMSLTNNKDFRSNAHLGGKAKDIKLSDKQKEMAEKIAVTMDLDYCGIDFFGNSDMPIEVNSNAFFETIESVCKVNVAKIFAQYIINKVGKV